MSTTGRANICLAAVLVVALAGAIARPASAETVLLEKACPAERALYELHATDGDEIWRLSFVPARNMASIASDLYLRLTTPQRDYWFTFSVSQGYGGISVLPITDPYLEPGPASLLAPPYGDNPTGATSEEVGGWLRFMPLDADLAISDIPPGTGDDAPAYILLPELGQGLWYSPAAFTSDPRADRDPMPRGLFRRTGCLVAPTVPALP